MPLRRLDQIRSIVRDEVKELTMCKGYFNGSALTSSRPQFCDGAVASVLFVMESLEGAMSDRLEMPHRRDAFIEKGADDDAEKEWWRRLDVVRTSVG